MTEQNFIKDAIMTGNPTNQSIPAPAAPTSTGMPAVGAAPVTTTPAVTPAPVTMPMVATSSMSNGGITSTRNIFADVNWLQTGILMLGTAALFYTIYYYRVKLKVIGKELPELNNRLDVVEAKVATAQKAPTTMRKRKVGF